MFLKMFRKKFRQTADITFLSVADLRKTFKKPKRMYSFSSTYLSMMHFSEPTAIVGKVC